MNIALFLSSDGIAMAHRQKAGHWAMIGETAFDVPDLAIPLSEMRAQAVEREGKKFKTLIVLPDDQILYTSLTVPTGDPELTAFRIEDGLEGLTPYAVTELEYAWEELEQDRVKIAVVANETLEEARGFAKQYGFKANGFAAMPPMEKFPGVPTFAMGNDADTLGFTADGMAFGPDTHSQPEPDEAPAAQEPDPAGLNEAPEAAPAEPESAVDPVAPPAAPPVDKAKGEGEAQKALNFIEDADDTVTTEAVSEDSAPEDALQDVAVEASAAATSADVPDTVDAAPVSDDLPLSDLPGPDLPGPDLPVSDLPVSDPPVADLPVPDERVMPQEMVDPTSDLVQNIEDDGTNAPVAPINEQPFGDTDDDEGLPPAPSAAVLMARERARIVRGQSASASAGDPAGEANTTPPKKMERPAFAGPPPTTDLTANRGPVSAPSDERGSLVGQRTTRFGLSAPTGPAAPPPDSRTPLTSDANPLGGAERTAPTPPTGPADGAANMPRLAEQLQRVRAASASKPATAGSVQPPRARVEIDPQRSLSDDAAPRRASLFDEPPADASPPSEGILSRLKGLRQKSAPKPASAPDMDTAKAALTAAEPAADAAALPDHNAAEETSRSGPSRRFGLRRGQAIDVAETSQTPGVAEDETFSSGLLARKATTQTGGSLRTGLVLTAILLLLLVLVAIWSAIFLPNSAVARLFGVGSPTVAVAPSDMDGFEPDVALTDTEVVAAPDPTLADEAAADGIETSAVLSDEMETPAEDPAEIAAAVEPELPDIDADLNLPPLPPIDQGLNPSLEEAEALYADDGIWARSPERPDVRQFDLVDRTYTASIDPDVTIFDAVALPDPGVDLAESFAPIPPPPPFGAEFNLTADGLVSPTPGGVETPEGAFIISGQPSPLPRQRPREVISETPQPEVEIEDALLGTLRPEERPSDLAEIRERQVLSGLTEAELADVRPVSRPASPQETAAQASLAPIEAATSPEEVEAAVREVIAGTELATARSLLPRTRPANISQIVASAVRSPAPDDAPAAVVTAAVAAAPSIPSNADVSRAATERNAMRLRDVNLIGVSGTSSDRRALVRLSSGRFVRVNVGDRLDGGRVAAIGATTLQYVRSGRTVTLEIPG